MFRQNRGFTVEIKGRRKAGAFDWKSAFAAAEQPRVLPPKSPEERTPASDDEILSDGPTPRRVLPALPKDERISEPLAMEVTPEISPALPVEPPPTPAPTTKPRAKRVVTAKPASRPLGNEEAQSDGLEASLSPPIEPIHHTRRIAVALSRAEKWKRRLPACLR